MALGPISGEPFRIDRITAPAATRLAGVARAAEAVQHQAPVSEDTATFTGAPLLMEEPPAPPAQQEAPRAAAPAVPEILLQETAAPAAGERILDAGTKLTYGQHVELMTAAAARGTDTVTVMTVAGVPRQVHVHGASPQEMPRIDKALKDLAAQDRHDLILRNAGSVYVADDLGSGKDGKVVAGVAVKMGEGDTAIMLSRMVGRAKKNPLERQNHVKNVLYHEIGHVVDNKYNLSALAYGVFGEGDKANTGMTGDFVSDYATTNSREDYAETFANFFESRTCSSLQECTDAEIMQVLSFGGQGRIQGKMERLVADLSPEVHCKEFLGRYVDERRERGEEIGPRQAVRKFYDDSDFRLQYVADVQAAYPAVPRQAVYEYMERTAELFGEPTPGWL